MKSNDSSYIVQMIANDSGIRLLRSRNPEKTISFLYKTFREKHQQTLFAHRFEMLLADFLQMEALASDEKDSSLNEFLDETELNEEIQFASQSFETKAHFLLDRWCSDEKGYIRKYYNERQEAIVELSAGVERLFTWLDNMDASNFVGTESRFKDILHRLRELSENTTQDPALQIEELEKKKAELQKRIDTIMQTNTAQMYTPVQIQERLTELSRSARELLSDFRQVEENFKVILNDIYKKQSMEESRGALLDYALEANLKIKETPQGQSFDSFWNFLIADAGKNEINTLTENIISQVQDANIEWNDMFLLHLKRYLQTAGRKIIDANHALTHRLSRAINSQNLIDKKALGELFASIKAKAFQCAEKEFALDPPLEIETRPLLNFPHARTFTLPLLKQNFSEINSFEEAASHDLIMQSGLFNQFFIDETVLKNNISEYKNKFLGSQKQFSLAELVEKFPVEKGLAEIVSYFALAHKLKEPHAIILDDARETISYEHNGSQYRLTLSKIVFG